MITTNHIVIYLPNQRIFKDRVNSLTRKKKKKERKERKKETVTQVVGTNYSLHFMGFNTQKSKLRTKIEQNTSLHTLPVGAGVRTGTEQIPKEKRGADMITRNLRADSTFVFLSKEEKMR